NDEVFAEFTAKDVADDAEIILEHGQPLIFGKQKNQGLRVKPGFIELEAVTIGEGGVTEEDILVHDETNRALAGMLALLEPPSMPVAIGVLYCDPRPSYDDGVKGHMDEALKHSSGHDINALLRRGHTWTITG
ncbi:MAG: 2-oxoacid:ferredoxin oxidoreductase subunit beta, partial [Proteobacteria bacterium]|nr:2-oxoacid:ferredoxin oxidoreductase subunit beta [Pseudomonadota bacterium]